MAWGIVAKWKLISLGDRDALRDSYASLKEMREIWVGWLKGEIENLEAVERGSGALMKPLNVQLWKHSPRDAFFLMQEYGWVSAGLHAMTSSIRVLENPGEYDDMKYGSTQDAVQLFLHFLAPEAKVVYKQLILDVCCGHECLGVPGVFAERGPPPL